MPLAHLPDVNLHYLDEGAPDGPPLVLAHTLGLDLQMWDALVPLLPEGLRIIRFDLRGHGGSDCPAPPYAMGALVRDTEALLDHLGVRQCAFAGLGLGGMVAQGLAVKRLDQVRALILAGTAAKIGQPETWRARAQSVETQGMQSEIDALLPRWFSRRAIAEGIVQPWCEQLLTQNPRGYAGGCTAIAGTDFYTPSSGLRLPCLGLAGAEDGLTPPDLVRETVDLIPGSQFQLIRRAGHLSCVEQPQSFADALCGFLGDIGHG